MRRQERGVLPATVRRLPATRYFLCLLHVSPRDKKPRSKQHGLLNSPLGKETECGGLGRRCPNLHPGWGQGSHPWTMSSWEAPQKEGVRLSTRASVPTAGGGKGMASGQQAWWPARKAWSPPRWTHVGQGREGVGMLQATHRQPGLPRFSREADLSRQTLRREPQGNGQSGLFGASEPPSQRLAWHHPRCLAPMRTAGADKPRGF